mmetsp:Transcript_105132/g.255223  ORF Transcript_105132/g.255223 Transcript_105132/m.255223 type:complete len:616 (-) Transcript_105132:279-2126(-)
MLGNKLTIALWVLAEVSAAISPSEEVCSENAGEASEESCLLSLRPRQQVLESHEEATSKKQFTLAGKSVYFLVIDRFARSGAQEHNYTFCGLQADWTNNTGGGWCGGTLEGIIRKIPYIKGMGFDCIWITPPVESNGYMGYDATNLFEINRHWGSKRDMKALSAALHKEGMCLVVDIVLNHMRALQINGTLALEGLHPFDKPHYYNQPSKKADQKFADYVLSSPPGTADWKKKQEDLDDLKANVDSGVLECGPTNPEQTECDCYPGNMGSACPRYDPVQQTEGWFGPLGDLNQSVPFVKAQLLKYVKYLVKSYGVDAFRLDTAIYMPKDFLKDMQEAAGVEILGEATVNNLTYHGSFQRDPKLGPVLTGLLNFAPFYQMPVGFCAYQIGGEFGDYSKQGTWFDSADLRGLGSVMDLQLSSDAYENLDLLGNFGDNHDEYGRLTWFCKYDSLRIKNLLTLVMTMRGIPIVYYGTEQELDGHQTKVNNRGQDALRDSLWQSKYNTSTWQYKYIALLNHVRKTHAIGAGEGKMRNYTESTLVFTRTLQTRSAMGPAWVFLNNAPNSTEGDAQMYCPGPPPALKGQSWYDVLSKTPQDQYIRGGCYDAPNKLPKVLVLQ